MYTKWLLPTLVLGLSTGINGCGSSDSRNFGVAGTPNSGGAGGRSSAAAGTGGSATAGTSSAGTGTAGTGTAGTSSAGTSSGGTSSGGTSSGGTGSGGKASGGASTGGGSSSGGSGGGGGSTAVRPSKGCGVMDGAKTLTMKGSSVASGLATSTRLKITTGGAEREYIIDIPADYDPNHPYRLIFSWHQAYGSDTGNAIGQYPANPGSNFDAKNYAYFGLQREATAAKQPAIFVAPGGIGNLPWDYKRDVALFDDLLALIDANLCIDDNRVFTTGFSFGAMMSYSLSITRQTKLRAAVTMAAANYNLPNQPSDSNAGPVAYLGFTGMSDGTCPWVNSDSAKTGGKYCVLAHAQDNGCTVPGTIQTAMVGSKKYLCYDFEGCKAGYPVKVCTFDGAHTPSSVDDGNSGGDDGLKAFIPPIAWKFISQF